MKHTHQSLVDRVYDWYIVQKMSPSVDVSQPVAQCMYVYMDTGCAIGINLAAEQKKIILDNNDNQAGISDVLERYPDIANDFDGCTENFLSDLQVCHDQSAAPTDITGRCCTVPVEDFRAALMVRLEALCNNWNLQRPWNRTGQDGR